MFLLVLCFFNVSFLCNFLSPLSVSLLTSFSFSPFFSPVTLHLLLLSALAFLSFPYFFCHHRYVFLFVVYPVIPIPPSPSLFGPRRVLVLPSFVIVMTIPVIILCPALSDCRTAPSSLVGLLYLSSFVAVWPPLSHCPAPDHLFRCRSPVVHLYCLLGWESSLSSVY